MENKLNEYTKTCPACNADWDGGSILETFIQQRKDGVKYWQGKTDAEIEQQVKDSYSPPYRWGRQIGIELNYQDPNHYDGISYIQCPDCKATFNRFTGEQESIN